MTLVLRDIPEDVERALRARAKAEGKTPEQIAIEAIAATTSPSSGMKSDFSAVVGTWVEDPVFDQIRREHEQIDPKLWK
jgi:plasmid stability protein